MTEIQYEIQYNYFKCSINIKLKLLNKTSRNLPILTIIITILKVTFIKTAFTEFNLQYNQYCTIVYFLLTNILILIKFILRITKYLVF